MIYICHIIYRVYYIFMLYIMCYRSDVFQKMRL